MSVITDLKLQNFNTARKDTARQVSNLLSQLNAQALKALKQQAYMRINPDNNVDAEFIRLVAADVAPTVAAFTEVQEKLNDIIACMSGEITPESIVTKYAIDMTAVSADLI